MKQPRILEGGSHTDERGTLRFVNDFDMSSVKRMYTTTNADTTVVRAWMAHKIESRWLKCSSGVFDVQLIYVEDWDIPLASEQRLIYKLKADTPQVLLIPPGYAIGFKASEKNSSMLIFSDYSMGEIDDNYKFSLENFKDWQYD